MPGANAALCALVSSGISPTNFIFLGFLSSKQSQRIKQLKSLRDYPQTLIIYEAPHRLKETLKDMYDIFKDRNITIARELTKKYEEYIRFTLKEAIEYEEELKGEIVLIVEGSKVSEELEKLLKLNINEHYKYYLKLGFEEKEALKKVANDRNVSKSDIYKTIKVK